MAASDLVNLWRCSITPSASRWCASTAGWKVCAALCVTAALLPGTATTICSPVASATSARRVQGASMI